MAVQSFRLSIIMSFKALFNAPLISAVLLSAALLSACVRPADFAPAAIPTEVAAATNAPAGTAAASTPAARNTAIPAPTRTETPAAAPTLPPASTSAPAASATPVAAPTSARKPQPAALSGTVVLSGDSKKPLSTQVELREKDSFQLLASAKSDAEGQYVFLNLLSGRVELWIQITEKPAMPGICGDVAMPGDAWRLGIKLGEVKGMTMENANLSKGLAFAEQLKDPTLKAKGFYAVLPDLPVEPGIGNIVDVTLVCK